MITTCCYGSYCSFTIWYCIHVIDVVNNFEHFLLLSTFHSNLGKGAFKYQMMLFLVAPDPGVIWYSNAPKVKNCLLESILFSPFFGVLVWTSIYRQTSAFLYFFRDFSILGNSSLSLEYFWVCLYFILFILRIVMGMQQLVYQSLSNLLNKYSFEKPLDFLSENCGLFS